MAYQTPNNLAPAVKTDFKVKCPYTVHLTYEAYIKLRAYVLNVKNEVGGWGSVSFDPETKVITVNDVFLIEQEVTAGTTVLDPKGMARFYSERKKENPDDDLGSYKLWWHSHAGFATIWSQTDNDTIDNLDPLEEGGWMLSIVDNYLGDLVARLDVYSPFRITYNQMVWWADHIPPVLNEQIKAEIEEKVRELVVVEKPKYWNQYRNKNKYVKDEKTTIYKPVADDYDDDWVKPTDEIVDEVWKDVGKTRN